MFNWLKNLFVGKDEAAQMRDMLEAVSARQAEISARVLKNIQERQQARSVGVPLTPVRHTGAAPTTPRSEHTVATDPIPMHSMLFSSHDSGSSSSSYDSGSSSSVSGSCGGGGGGD